MRAFSQSRDCTRVLERFGLERLLDIGSTVFDFAVLGVPGVARRLVTFFASPKKVTKERRPEVRRRFAVPWFSRRKAALCETPASPQNDKPLRNSGSNGRRFKRLSLCSPSDSPRGLLLSFLRYSATLIGARSYRDGRGLFPSSSLRRGPSGVELKKTRWQT